MPQIVAGDLRLQLIGVLQNPLPLQTANCVARKFRGEEVGLCGEASGTRQQLMQRFAGQYAIDTCRDKLALELYKLRLLRAWNANIGF